MAKELGRHRLSCGRKIGMTKQKAAGAAARMRSHYPGSRFDIYKCTVCGCWHVGNRRPAPADQEEAAIAS